MDLLPFEESACYRAHPSRIGVIEPFTFLWMMRRSLGSFEPRAAAGRRQRGM